MNLKRNIYKKISVKVRINDMRFVFDLSYFNENKSASKRAWKANLSYAYDNFPSEFNECTKLFKRMYQTDHKCIKCLPVSILIIGYHFNAKRYTRMVLMVLLQTINFHRNRFEVGVVLLVCYAIKINETQKFIFLLCFCLSVGDFSLSICHWFIDFNY